MKKVIIPALAFVFFTAAANAQDVKKTEPAQKQTTVQAQPQQAQPAATNTQKPAEATATENKATDSEKKNEPNQAAPAQAK